MNGIYNPIMEGAFERQARKYEEAGLPNYYSMKIISFNSINIGFLAFKKLNDEVLYLVGLYILTQYQRKGFGRKVLEAIKNEQRKK